MLNLLDEDFKLAILNMLKELKQTISKELKEMIKLSSSKGEIAEESFERHAAYKKLTLDSSIDIDWELKDEKRYFMQTITKRDLE